MYRIQRDVMSTPQHPLFNAFHVDEECPLAPAKELWKTASTASAAWEKALGKPSLTADTIKDMQFEIDELVLKNAIYMRAYRANPAPDIKEIILVTSRKIYSRRRSLRAIQA